jgi:broad specificity phosphatase PhoE
MIRLILVRHGVTEWNQAGRYQGRQDVPLSDAGRQQAKQVAKRLRDERITSAYASDLQRASETAAIVLDGRDVPLQLDPSLREMSFGAWEGLSAGEASARYPAEWAAWIRDPTTARPPGGAEDNDELQARVVAFYQSIVRPAPVDSVQPDWFMYRAAGESAAGTSTILVVSHGGVIRALLAHLFEIRIELYWRFGIRPASVSILDVYPEGAIAEVVGETSHVREMGASDAELITRAQGPSTPP